MGKRSKSRPRYPTDLSDGKWREVQGLILAQKRLGRPREVSLRRVLDALFFITRAGCAWRLLPKKNFPPWETIYGYFRQWSKAGVWQYDRQNFRGTARDTP